MVQTWGWQYINQVEMLQWNGINDFNWYEYETCTYLYVILNSKQLECLRIEKAEAMFFCFLSLVYLVYFFSPSDDIDYLTPAASVCPHLQTYYITTAKTKMSSFIIKRVSIHPHTDPSLDFIHLASAHLWTDWQPDQSPKVSQTQRQVSVLWFSRSGAGLEHRLSPIHMK